MATKYRVQGPDGTVHIFEGPDNATPSQVEDFAAQTFGVEQKKLQSSNRTFADVPGEALANVLPSGAKFFGGLAEAITSPIQTAKGLLDVGAGALQNVLPKKVVDFVSLFDANPQAAKRAVDSANAVGGMYRDRYGSIEGLKNTLATDPVGAAADLSTLLSGGAMATSRVAPTAAKVLSTAATYTNPVAPVVGALNLGVKTGASVGESVYNAFSPKSKAYVSAAEGKAPEILNALVSAQEFVPGSAPTAAQAAVPAGSTRFAALGKQAAEKLPSEFLARESAQKEAQLAAIRNVGKTADEIKAAEIARSSSTDPLYKIADQALIPSDSTFIALSNRPSMDKVLARAKQLAEEKAQVFQIGKDAPAQTIPSSILGADGKPIGFTNVPAEVAQYPGTSLHYVKLAFDDLIRDPATFGIGKNEVNAISGTRTAFLKWFENKVPEYGQARELFSAGSKPINQMQIAQFLEGKLRPVLGEETGRLRSTGFATAVENAPATIQKAATGSPRYDSLSKIMTPEQMAVIDGVKNDLSRIAEVEYMARKGTKAGPNLLTTGSEALAGLQTPSFLNRTATLANEIIRRLKGGVNEKIAIEIATEMLDPKVAASALRKAMLRDAEGKRFFDPFKKPELSPEKIRNIGVGSNALAPANQNAMAEAQ